MSRTYEAFAQDCLGAIGNLAPLQGTLNFMAGWMGCESGGSANAAANNPLNCTLSMAGDSVYNSAGVKNYPNWSEGVVATVTTLKNGLYPDLLAALLENDAAALRGPSAGVNADLSMWSAGSYTAGDYYCGRQFYSDGAQYLNDLVAGNGPGGNPAPPPGSSPPLPNPVPSGIPGWFQAIAQWIQNALSPTRWIYGILGLLFIGFGLALAVALFAKSPTGQTAAKTAVAAAAA